MKKFSPKWVTKMLLQDNAPVHRARTAVDDLRVRTTYYSPGLVSSDFYLIPNLKSRLAGHRYEMEDHDTLGCRGLFSTICRASGK